MRLDISCELSLFQTQLRDLEEKYKQSMVHIARLDNIKLTHVYQLELLKEQIEEKDESLTEKGREYRDKCRVSHIITYVCICD